MKVAMLLTFTADSEKEATKLIEAAGLPDLAVKSVTEDMDEEDEEIIEDEDDE